MNFQLSNTFTKELPADPITSNVSRSVTGACYSFVNPQLPSNPERIHISHETAHLLGLSAEDIDSQELLDIVSGAKILNGTTPYAMCYGGHQFGYWAGQLGDGRAINLMDISVQDRPWTLQLKGAGRTPYSRTADGLAVLRSSVREHLCSEAMHHLGVATTRSLSLCLSGDKVLRDVLYDGNSAYEKGAIVCRVAPSFIRFGNFQIFTSRGDIDNLKKLCDYTIRHFFPKIRSEGKQAYLDFFEEVMKRTFDMILQWQRVGFVHGVMNTDNMSILGLTIDYGPYGWLDAYDRDWTPNTTDRQHRRYRFGNQAPIAHWNLYQLANALFPLIQDKEALEGLLKAYQSKYIQNHLQMMKAKLGLRIENPNDAKLVESLMQTLSLVETDMTIFYRELSKVKKASSPDTALDTIQSAFYENVPLNSNIRIEWEAWMQQYLMRLQIENQSDTKRAVSMNKINPKYVLRNYMAQLAIDAAEKGDYTIIDELYHLLKSPYQEQKSMVQWYAKRPDWAKNKIGCSMLSCSS